MKLDPAAREFVLAQQKAQAEAQAQTQAKAKPKRVTPLRPHETHRKPRAMNITFPTAAWPKALRDLADKWGLRPADLVTWCVSYAIRQVLDGEVDPPDGEGRRQHHTACEWMDLPWRPKGDHE